ncbi:MAG TPA: M13 family metallopeptidase [Gemmatimonadaceae bacterium]
MITAVVRRLSVVLTVLPAFGVVRAQTQAARSRAAAPQYGAWGIDLAGEDKAVRPGNDFFRYVNGRWLDRTAIPADKPSYSLRAAMSDVTERRLHELLEAAAAKSSHQSTVLDGKVGAFYHSFMDSARVERLGVTPVAPLLTEIKGATNRGRIAGLMGRATADLYGSIFNVGMDVDLKDPKVYSEYIGQGGLILPERDYYIAPDFAPQRAAFRQFAATALRVAGWPDAERAADSVVAFQTRLASASWTMTEQRDAVATYNPMSVDSLVGFAPGFDWRAFLSSAQLGDVRHVVIAERSAFPRLARVFAETPISTLQADLAVTVLYNAGPYLARSVADAWFAFHGRALSGQDAEEARWKRGVHAVSGGDYLSGDRFDRFGNMGWAVGQLYTNHYFPAATKAQIERLVANLKTAMHARIAQLDWMSPGTKREALKKLDTYTIKVGYPDTPRDYASVDIRDDDLVGNVRRAAAADWTFFVRRRPGPVDRSEWAMTPQTNDAYNGSLRDIVFPAGILQPPIFDPAADDAVNYGAVGGVIGHELTHGFDDQGRTIDAAGALRDWWTKEDAARFTARAKALGAQYDSYEPLPGMHVNGGLTMGENIADLGGLTMALDAYRTSLGGAKAPVLDGYTGEQRVFMGWAQAWRGKLRDAALRKQVASDPHSPRLYRVNGPVRNIDAWYTAFGVTPRDSLYLTPATRVHIW